MRNTILGQFRPSLPQADPRQGQSVAHRRRLIALFLREAAGDDHPSLALLVRLVEPVVLIFATIALSWLINRQPPYGTSMLLWAVTGIGPIYLFIRIVRYVTTKRGTHLPFYSDMDVCLVQGFVELVFVTLSIFFLFWILYRWNTPQAFPAVIPCAIEGWLTTACLAFGVGLVNRQLWRMFNLWHVIFPALTRALLHLSGVYFVVDTLPPEIRGWMALNPLVHAVILFRLGFYPTFPDYVLSVSYFSEISFGALVLGTALEFLLGERIEAP